MTPRGNVTTFICGDATRRCGLSHEYNCTLLRLISTAARWWGTSTSGSACFEMYNAGHWRQFEL